jgi:hypothetical protein
MLLSLPSPCSAMHHPCAHAPAPPHFPLLSLHIPSKRLQSSEDPSQYTCMHQPASSLTQPGPKAQLSHESAWLLLSSQSTLICSLHHSPRCPCRIAGRGGEGAEREGERDVRQGVQQHWTVRQSSKVIRAHLQGVGGSGIGLGGVLHVGLRAHRSKGRRSTRCSLHRPADKAQPLAPSGVARPHTHLGSGQLLDGVPGSSAVLREASSREGGRRDREDLALGDRRAHRPRGGRAKAGGPRCACLRAARSLRPPRCGSSAMHRSQARLLHP